MSDLQETIVIETLSAGDEAALLQMVVDAQQERGQIANNELRNAVKGVFMQAQADWISDKSDVRVWEKSRRIGCTWACAAEAVLEASMQRGMSQYYMGYNLGMAAEFIGDCAMFARAFGVAISAIGVSRETHFIRNERKDITLYRVRFANGRVIEALSSNPLNWRGRQGHARIDEAGHIAGLRALVDAAMAWRLWGGRVSITGTHNGEESEFNQLLAEVKAGELDYALHYTDFDVALAQGFYKRVCLRTGKDWSAQDEIDFRAKAFKSYTDKERADEELMCVPRKSSGEYMSRVLLENASVANVPNFVFKCADEYVRDPERVAKARRWFETHLQPVLEQLDRTKRTAFGQDFARSGDASGALISQELTPGEWTPVLYFEMRNVPFDVQEWLIIATLRPLPRLKRAKFDARGNGQALAEKAFQDPAVGAFVDQVMVSAELYSEQFPRYRAALQALRFKIAGMKDVIDDHRLIQLVNSEPRIIKRRTKSSVDASSRHGDSMVAHFMCFMATQDRFEPPAGACVAANSDSYKFAAPSSIGRQPLLERHTAPAMGITQRVRGLLTRTLAGRL